MSGALASFGATVGRVSSIAGGAVQSATALANLFNGRGGAGGTLSLGSFSFQEFELPEQITCGGTQQVNVHKLTGGGRVIDSMGPDEAPISWSGLFLAADAAARAAAPSELRRLGRLVPLAWSGINVPVVITDVSLEWRRTYHVGYRITCMVVPPPPANASDEDDDLDDMDDEAPGGGILGALGDAAGSVGEVVSDVAAEAGRIVGIAQGALSSVISVVGPVTAALGIQVPFLSSMQAGLSIASGIVGFTAGAGAGLSGFGAQYGGQALDQVGRLNGDGFTAADGYTNAFDGSGIDIASSPQTLNDAASASRDSAVGASTGAAINSAQVANRASANYPAPPMQPAQASASVPGSSAPSGGISAPAASAPASAPVLVPDAPAAPVAVSPAPAAPQPGNALSPGDLNPAELTYAPISNASSAPAFGSDSSIQGARNATAALNSQSGQVPVQTYDEVQRNGDRDKQRATYIANSQATAHQSAQDSAGFQSSLVGTFYDPALVAARKAAAGASQ